jgi:hypothetical protein
MLFEQLIDAVLRRHNIGQYRAHEQGSVITEPSNDLRGESPERERVASSESLDAAGDRKTG